MSCALKRGFSIIVFAFFLSVVSCTTTAPFILSLTGLPTSITIPASVILTATGGPGSSRGLFTWTFSTNCGGTFSSTATPNNGPGNPLTIGPTSATAVQVTYDSTGATPVACTFTVTLTTSAGRTATLRTSTILTSIRKIYWTQGHKILRANLDGTNIETLIHKLSVLWSYLALDVPAGKIYVGSYDGLIQRANFDGSEVEDLIVGGPGASIYGIIGIALHGDKIYIRTKDRFYRAQLDGTNLEMLFRYHQPVPPSGPHGFAVDPTRGKIYWSNSYEYRGIYRANLDGTEIEQIVNIMVPSIALDVARGKIYWTEWGFHEPGRGNSIRRANLDGTDIEDLVSGLDHLPNTIALDMTRGKMYWTDWPYGIIYRANLDGSHVEQLTSGLGGKVLSMALDSTNRKIYMTRPFSSMLRMNLDGSGLEEVAKPFVARGIAVDMVDNKIYWVNQWVGIQRANLDGTGIEDLGIGGELIALDIAARKIYLSREGYIGRANLDGSGVEDLVTGFFFWPGGLALDVSAGKMYWSEYNNDNGAPRIRRANLDGTDVEDLLSDDGIVDSCSGNLAVDVMAGKIYWASWGIDIQQYVIRSANLDGSDPQDLIILGDHNPAGLTLDMPARKIYWSTGDKIQRANLDGTSIEDFLIFPFTLQLMVCGIALP